MTQMQRPEAKPEQDQREQATIDSLILANHVEAVNGLLYISGGGWTDHNRQIQPGGNPPISHLGIGLCLLVPWNETNKQHELVLLIENEDATTTIMRAEMKLNVGRPPTLRPGSQQPVMMGMTVDTIFPKPGGYRVVAELKETGQRKTWPFRVNNIPLIAALIPPVGS